MVRRKKLTSGRIVFAALLTAFVTVGIIAAVSIITAQSGYALAQDEYEALRLYAPNLPTSAPASAPEGEAASPAEAIPTQPIQPAAPEQPRNLSEINPDYIGWIRIDGTGIDYPVVRGEDNDKYLAITFGGEQNASGSIFMDYRCTAGFESPLPMLHGHNMKDGSMFAELNKYVASGFRDEHPQITILTQDGETLAYHIFAVVKTNVFDTAYTLHSGDLEAIGEYMAALSTPDSAERYIALSTCTYGDDDERLLVFGAL